MPEEKNSNPRGLLKYIPFFTLIGVIMGFLNLHGYYRQFQIDILNYLTTSELLFSLLPYSVFVIVGWTLPAMILAFHTKESLLDLVIKLASKPGQKIYTCFLMIILIGLYFFFYQNIEQKRWFPLISGFFWFSHLMLFIYLLIGLVQEITPNLKDVLFIGFILTLCTILLFVGEKRAILTKKFGQSRKYTLKVNNQLIQDHRDRFVIGETQLFFFIYSRIDSTTTVIKRDEIDSLVIK